MRSRRGKTLSPADIALWREVARSVTPLPGRKPVEPEQPEPAAPTPIMAEATILVVAAKPVQSKPTPPPLAPLERRLRTQLRRGQQGVEAVIDLHGMRQDEAHLALRAFLRREQARGCKLALVVTGKGAAGDSLFGEERGVLRRMVPHWLRLPDLRPLVVGFEEAEQRHGGTGALYIRLRRQREIGP
ncbi:DNA-nicking endonuclease, Smr domain [Bosea sp. OK403]|jgi:DNA-nicking Smr family endonuclease|uniref:Smr/MutS family protein n=1 Tax=Bosea sp. OK403 TaxID=1855286 RepID=UPI0008E57466|nr:Smr/MutS family protein [Bosea sp. OK403]SFJ93383.1 DNA-nicking endonuclease, Smr domain [Bosea sp. OK403]